MQKEKRKKLVPKEVNEPGFKTTIRFYTCCVSKNKSTGQFSIPEDGLKPTRNMGPSNLQDAVDIYMFDQISKRIAEHNQPIVGAAYISLLLSLQGKTERFVAHSFCTAPDTFDKIIAYQIARARLVKDVIRYTKSSRFSSMMGLLALYKGGFICNKNVSIFDMLHKNYVRYFRTKSPLGSVKDLAKHLFKLESPTTTVPYWLAESHTKIEEREPKTEFFMETANIFSEGKISSKTSLTEEEFLAAEARAEEEQRKEQKRKRLKAVLESGLELRR